MRKKIWLPALCLCFLLLIALPVQARQGPTLVIRSAEGFLKFAENCRLDSYSQGLNVSLAADIDLSGTDFSGIPIFCGTFDGGGHTVSGIRLESRGSALGLFRYLTQSATVQNLRVRGEIMPQGSRDLVGGIAGHNAGIITGCSFDGSVSGDSSIGGIAGHNSVTGIIEDCRVSGSVHGTHFVGGLAGDNLGVIRSCENTAAVNTTVRQNNVDISDITLGTITGTESAATVTDIGGIAGHSSGTIRSCVNRGDIGYRQMGYNIGGIAGSQSGYLKECENYGTISGRKEVGGIVGQAEPAIELRYETDTLQLLQAEMAVLSDLTDRAQLNIQNQTANIQRLLLALDDHITNAQTALDSLVIDPDHPTVPDGDTYLAAFQTLGSSITGIDRTLRELRQAVQTGTTTLSEDLQAISDQLAVIDTLLEGAEENLGGTIRDVSDLDTPEDLTGKIERCTNYGKVSGDLNTGGIVGAMSTENDLDPEADLQVVGTISLNAAGNVRCVILECENQAPVTANKRNAGGIAGWQSLGLLKQCVNSGDILSENADYTGGIAGQSSGYIRRCSSKCTVAGKRYVGGVAGMGTVVSDCCSIPLLSGSEKLGAILGALGENFTREETPLRDNCYLRIAGDPGGIDGISYAGQAQPLSESDFLSLEHLPDSFLQVKVLFRFEDGTEQAVDVPFGGWLKDGQVPALPEKPGFTGKWVGLSEIRLRDLYFDATVTAVYTAYDAVIQSTQTRPDGRSILLALGSFTDRATVSIAASEQKPPLQQGQQLLESWDIHLSDGEILRKLRFLPEQAVDGAVALWLLGADGTWQAAEYTQEGSYLIFGAEAETVGIALVRNAPPLWPWIAGGCGLLILLSGGIVLIRRKKARKGTTPPEAPAE